MKNYFVVGIISFLSFISCKTDFELNAPYELTPVVYGLLDQSADTQFVKINKSFLGDGNNVSYAAINDCTLFDSLIAVIEAYDVSNDLISQDTLKEIWVNGLDSGIFYEGYQKVYYLSTLNNPLNDDYEYHLKVNVPNQDLNFSSVTSLVDNGGPDPNYNYLFQTIRLYGLQSNGLRFVDKTILADDNYVDQPFSWKSSENGERYEFILRFHFYEHFLDGTIVSRYVDWNLGTQKSNDADYSGVFEKIIAGSAFYDMISSKLNGYNIEGQVEKRTFNVNPIEFILTVGNDALNTYMEVNEPVTGIVTEKPVFTNINNGVGVFASKYQCSISLGMQDGTILELCLGAKTSGFKFCYDVVNDINGYVVGCDQ